MILNWTCFSPKEADTKAQALCDELGGQFIYADAKSEGNTEIRPGLIVKLEKMGQHSGEYYITETRHTYHERVYVTEFSVRGLRGGNLLTTISPANHLQPGQNFTGRNCLPITKTRKVWVEFKVKFSYTNRRNTPVIGLE